VLISLLGCQEIAILIISGNIRYGKEGKGREVHREKKKFLVGCWGFVEFICFLS